MSYQQLLARRLAGAFGLFTEAVEFATEIIVCMHPFSLLLSSGLMEGRTADYEPPISGHTGA